MEAKFFSFLKSSNVNISPLIHPPDAPVLLNGVTNAWKLGALTKDTGYSRVSTQIQSGKSITGAYHFIQDPSTEKMLVTVDDATSDDTQLFYKTTAGAWTEIGAAETAWANVAGAKVEMLGFLGYCFFVGYSAVDGFLPVGSLTGTTFSTSTNVTGMPQAKFILKYRSRIYLLNVKYGGTHYPYRAVASGIPSAGSISWSTAGAPDSSTGGFFDIDYEHEITGGAVNWDKMVIFTDESAYMYDQSSLKEVWAEGCSSHRTIKKKGVYLIWANGDGVWVSTGGQPQNIAGEMIDFIRAGNPADFFGEVVDEVYHLYVGTVTVNGITYTNCVLKFNIAVSTWESREYASNMTIFARYKNPTTKKKRLYMGDADGNVWDKAKYTDSTLISSDKYVDTNNTGVEIPVNFVLAPVVLSDLSDLDYVKSLIAYSDRGQGLTLKYRVIDRNSQVLNEFQPLGKIETMINHFEDLSLDKGAIIQIAGAENSKDPYFSFYGFALEIDKVGKLAHKTLK